jgi:hypothetical protein
MILVFKRLTSGSFSRVGCSGTIEGEETAPSSSATSKTVSSAVYVSTAASNTVSSAAFGPVPS